ncbi:MAG: tetratricopeptide repeat protein [Deltaproteobacteria bacterium]|jgi:lipoprotein NlpI|nr:tetratricopeptide repeat protein [Deltaproteobacteria bacterium]
MKQVRELITLGKQHFDNKEYDRAEQYLQKVLHLNVKYADVFNMLGVVAHVKGRFASAIDYFTRALEINSNYTEAALNLAVLYNDLGQYDDAKKLYGSLRKNSKKTNGQIEPVLRGKLSNLHADIGDIYRSIGLYPFAIDEYEKALHHNPKYYDIRTKLGQALREHGNCDDSLKEFKKVLKNDPKYCPALIQQGITFYTMEKVNNAVKSWKAALDKDPENKYAQMYLRLSEATSKLATPPVKKSPKAKKISPKAKKIKTTAKNTSPKKRTKKR